MPQRTQLTQILKDPAELRLHPLKKTQPKAPEWDKGGAAFHALIDDIRDRGFDHALLIAPDGSILDGEVRWLAAKQLRLAEVPVVETDADPASVILGTLVQRRHLSKSAIAFLAFPLLKPAFDAAHSRMLKSLKMSPNHGSLQNRLPSVQTVEELAERMGISRALLFQAKTLHEKFAKHPEIREKFETPLLSGEVALGATLAGISGFFGTAGQRKGDSGQLELWKNVVEAGFNRVRFWNDVKDNPELWAKVDEKAAQLDPGELETLMQFHAAMAGRLRRLLKEGVGA